MHNDITYEWKTAGHQQVKRQLDLQISNNSVAQSYLFLGPDGVGKRLLAKEFAARIVASNNAFLEFDFATQGVEDLRELLSRIALRPLAGQRQVVILDGAEHMQPSTSNALLKTLEEPSASTTLILISNRTNTLATVVSRCQTVQFGKLSEAELRSVGEGFGVVINDAAVKVVHGIPARLQVVVDGNGKETKFVLWEKEIKDLLASSVLSRVMRASTLAAEEVTDLEDRLCYWLEYFMQSTEDAPQLPRRLKIVQESFNRLQKNGNRKLVMEYLCLNI